MDNLNALMTATEREVLDLADQLISGLQAAELRCGAPMPEHRAELKHKRQLVLDNVLRRQQVREAEARPPLPWRPGTVRTTKGVARCVRCPATPATCAARPAVWTRAACQALSPVNAHCTNG
jgi:hypothetical protein